MVLKKSYVHVKVEYSFCDAIVQLFHDINPF